MMTVTPHQFRQKTDEEICQWIAGWNDKTGIGYRLLGQHELQRRLRQPDAVRSWIAIGISTLAIILSILFRFLN
jgi:hypothetical protein